MMKKSVHYGMLLAGVITLCMLELSSPVFAVSSGGSIHCSGDHNYGLNGTELLTTVYSLRNLDDFKPIEIRRVRIYTADGILAVDMPNTRAFPPGFRDLLEPHQSTRLHTYDLFSGGLPDTQRPLQTFIDWAVAVPPDQSAAAVDLLVDNMRLVRDGQTNAEIARQFGRCRRL